MGSLAPQEAAKDTAGGRGGTVQTARISGSKNTGRRWRGSPRGSELARCA